MPYSSVLIKKAFATGQALKASFTVGRPAYICVGSQEYRATFCPTRLHAFANCYVLSARRGVSGTSAIQTPSATSAANEALDMSKIHNLAGGSKQIAFDVRHNILTRRAVMQLTSVAVLLPSLVAWSLLMNLIRPHTGRS